MGIDFLTLLSRWLVLSWANECCMCSSLSPRFWLCDSPTLSDMDRDLWGRGGVFTTSPVQKPREKRGAFLMSPTGDHCSPHRISSGLPWVFSLLETLPSLCGLLGKEARVMDDDKCGYNAVYPSRLYVAFLLSLPSLCVNACCLSSRLPLLG